MNENTTIDLDSGLIDAITDTSVKLRLRDSSSGLSDAESEHITLLIEALLEAPVATAKGAIKLFGLVLDYGYPPAEDEEEDFDYSLFSALRRIYAVLAAA